MQSQDHREWLPYKTEEGNILFTSLVIQQKPEKTERSGYSVRRIYKKKQFDDEIYDIDKFKLEKTKVNKKKGQKNNPKQK